MKRSIGMLSLIVLGSLIYSEISSINSLQHNLARGMGALMFFIFAWNSRIQSKEFSWILATMGLICTAFIVDDLTGYSWSIIVMTVVFAVIAITWLYRGTRPVQSE